MKPLERRGQGSFGLLMDAAVFGDVHGRQWFGVRHHQWWWQIRRQVGTETVFRIGLFHGGLIGFEARQGRVEVFTQHQRIGCDGWFRQRGTIS